jgi:hypothetical protein
VPSTHTPSQQPAEFDALCANVGEWDPLPSATPLPPEEDQRPDEERQTAAMDRLIFAGLVSPL